MATISMFDFSASFSANFMAESILMLPVSVLPLVTSNCKFSFVGATRSHAFITSFFQGFLS